jgi:hypothetical protein
MPMQLMNEAKEYLKVLELCLKYMKTAKGLNPLLVKGTKEKAEEVEVPQPKAAKGKRGPSKEEVQHQEEA